MEILAPKAPKFQQLQHIENGMESPCVLLVTFPCLCVYLQLLRSGGADRGWRRLLKARAQVSANRNGRNSR